MNATMLMEADAFLARKLFFPIIIGICRLTGTTQYGFASYASVLSALCIAPLIMAGGSGASLLAQSVVLAAVATMVAYHAMHPEMVRRPRGFWRGFTWAMIGLNILQASTGKFQLYALLMWVFQLFAEYALMIDTIPPLEAIERRSASKASSPRRRPPV
jgi:hypothetical protein